MKRVSNARSRAGAWREQITRQTREHPGRSAALALGAGFLLGGGLFSPLTARLLRVGMRLGLRLVVMPFVTQSLVSLGQDLFVRGAGARDADGDIDDNGGSSPNQTPSVHKEK